MNKHSLLKIPMSEREPFLYIERSKLDVQDGAIKQTRGEDTLFYPCANFCCIMVGLGCSITHEVAKILNKAGTTMLFVGEGACRYYNSMGCHSPNSNEKALKQISLYHNNREDVARKIYAKMFHVEESDLAEKSIDRMRGMEGNRVRGIYKELSQKYKVPWVRRDFNLSDNDNRDIINQALNISNTCLYAFCESIILSCGLLPQIGFIHNTSRNSLCLDFADVYKFTFFTKK